MTLIAQTECCTLLGIDPKTLRTWLKRTDISFTAHPTDVRLKCLTASQVQQLAASYHRPLPPTPPASLSLTFEADLHQTLLDLQVQVVGLHEQLAHLTQEVQALRREHHSCAQSALLAPAQGLSPSSPILSEATTQASPTAPPPPTSPSLSTPARTSSRALALIAATATGSYVLLCPTRGELPFAPDSSEWFDWLATLSSFRFVGKLGRLSASRNRGRPCWMAYRRIHGHCYNYGLGNTKRLTIAHLEQMAATLQSHVPSL
jgi:hypothetical protein